MEVEGVDTCMLKEYLEKNYGYNEPIFINEIQLDGLNAVSYTHLTLPTKRT